MGDLAAISLLMNFRAIVEFNLSKLIRNGMASGSALFLCVVEAKTSAQKQQMGRCLEIFWCTPRYPQWQLSNQCRNCQHCVMVEFSLSKLIRNGMAPGSVLFLCVVEAKTSGSGLSSSDEIDKSDMPSAKTVACKLQTF